MAGSSSTMMECMNYLASLNLLKAEELVKSGYYNPLKLIDVDPDLITSDYEVVFNEDRNIFQIERRSLR